jgi:uncharacterized protein
VPVVAAFAVVLGSISQAATGFGFSLVCSPFLVAAYGAPRGVQLSLTLSIALNAVLLALGRGHVAWRKAGVLLVPAVVATVGVGWLVRDADRSTLTTVSGAICLAGVVAIASGARTTWLHGPVGTIVAGRTSGAMTVVAGIGGPPVVLFGQNAAWPHATARATLQAFFLGMNAVALATIGLPDRIPPGPAVALVAGLPVGWWVQSRLSDRIARPLVLVVAAVGSALAIERGLT